MIDMCRAARDESAAPLFVILAAEWELEALREVCGAVETIMSAIEGPHTEIVLSYTESVSTTAPAALS